MARRQNDYYSGYYFPPSKPLKAKGGIRAHSKRGTFAKNWWAKRWIGAMEWLMDSGRLQRGRRYARQGQVLSVEEAAGGVVARVQGSQETPYEVSIQVKPFSDAQWEGVFNALANKAIFAAQLLAGEMPQDIEEAFAAAGVSLFPDDADALTTDCSCPDWANPCKHIAATHYILGDRFDEDPFLLFRLRGRSQEQVLEALRQRRVGQEVIEDEPQEEKEEEETIPLEESISRFWEMGEPLASFPLDIKPPPVEFPILKRLGEAAFVTGDSLEDLLGPAYRAITQAALAAAYNNGQEQSDER